jgi:hypothetical protein
MPRSSEILTVQVQYNIPCIWALVDPDLPNEGRKFIIKGTGHKVNSLKRIKYIGTFQMISGDFIGHLFELIL